MMKLDLVCFQDFDEFVVLMSRSGTDLNLRCGGFHVDKPVALLRMRVRDKS